MLLPGLCDMPFHFYKWKPVCTVLYFKMYRMLRAFNFLLGAMWSLWIYTNWEQRCISRSKRGEVGLQRSRCDAVSVQKLTEMQMQYVEFQPRQKVEFALFSHGPKVGKRRTKNCFLHSFSPCFWNGNTWVKVTSGSQVFKMLLKCWVMEKLIAWQKKKSNCTAATIFSILTFTYCNPSHRDTQYLHQLLMDNRSFILINGLVWLILIYRFLKSWGQKWELFSGAQTLSRCRRKECHSHRGAVFKTIYCV